MILGQGGTRTEKVCCLSTLNTMHLRQQRQDGGSCMPADDRDVHILDVEALCLGDKCVCTDNVEACDTNDLLRIIDTEDLQCLGSNGDS